MRLPILLVLAAAVMAPSLPAHVALTSPNGGETFQGQSLAQIQWFDTISHGSGVTYTLRFSADGGTSWSLIASGLPYTGGVGSFDWQVPDAATTQGMIRVEMIVNPNLSYSDQSDGPFTIQPSYVSYGAATPLQGVAPLLDGVGVPSVGAGILVHLGQAQGGASVHFLGGTRRTNFSAQGVTVLTQPTLAEIVRTAGAAGEIFLPVTLPASLAGATVDVQAVVLSTPAYSATAGLEFRVLP